MKRARSRLWLVTLLAALTACSQPRAESATDTCTAAVIVGLRAEPNDALLAELARGSSAKIRLLRPMAAGLYLLDVEAAGDDAACTAAIERLRLDARVLSADRDERRRPQAP